MVLLGCLLYLYTLCIHTLILSIVNTDKVCLLLLNHMPALGEFNIAKGNLNSIYILRSGSEHAFYVWHTMNVCVSYIII